jgi:hypothetical protein
MDAIAALLNLDATLITSWLLAVAIYIFPRLILALIVLLVGRWLANKLALAVEKIINSLNLKQIIASFQLGIRLPPDLGQNVAKLAGYWSAT